MRRGRLCVCCTAAPSAQATRSASRSSNPTQIAPSHTGPAWTHRRDRARMQAQSDVLGACGSGAAARLLANSFATTAGERCLCVGSMKPRPQCVSPLWKPSLRTAVTDRSADGAVCDVLDVETVQRCEVPQRVSSIRYFWRANTTMTRTPATSSSAPRATAARTAYMRDDLRTLQYSEGAFASCNLVCLTQVIDYVFSGDDCCPARRPSSDSDCPVIIR